MRIGFFTSIEGWGGSESYLLSLMRGVQAAGHIPVLFGIEGSRLYRDAGQAKIETVPWKRATCPANFRDIPAGESEAKKTGMFGRQRLLEHLPLWVKLLAGNMSEVALLRRVFRDKRVDVMHVSNSGYEVAGVACKLCGTPALVMNMITPPPESCWTRRWLMRATLKSFDQVSSQSQFCTDAWIQFAGVDPEKCSFVWNGVDLEKFSPKMRGVRRVTDPFRMVSIGRLHPMKGFDYLIEAMNLLADDRMILDIVGEGREAEHLRELINKKGLEKRVFLRGYDEHPEKYLATADCFVLASVSHESCPAVLPEAMACGLPLITSNFGPLAEVNIDGTTGLVVPVRDGKALADAMLLLADDPLMSQRLGDAGRTRAILFGRQRMIQLMLGIYERMRYGRI